MSFRVLCEVWGGVTGHRSGYMKNDGEVMEFQTRAEAQRLADEALEAKTHSATQASFRYTVEEHQP